MLAHGEALIGGVDDEGVVVLAGFLERGDELADAFIDGGNAFIDLAHPVVEAFAFLAFAKGFAALSSHRIAVGAFRPCLLFIEVIGFAFAGWENVGGHRDFGIFVAAFVAFGGGGWTVNAAVADPEVPWLCSIAVFATDVIERPLGVVVGRVAFDGLLLAIDAHDLRFVVGTGVFGMQRAIPNDLMIPIAPPTGVSAGVPLADLCGVVALLAHFRWNEGALLWIVSTARVFALHRHGLDAVRKAPGEHGGTRWHAPGAKIGGMEADAVFCQRINVRGLHPGPGAWVAAHGFGGLVVGVDEEDVWALRLRCENVKRDGAEQEGKECFHGAR